MLLRFRVKRVFRNQFYAVWRYVLINHKPMFTLVFNRCMSCPIIINIKTTNINFPHIA